MHRAIDAAADFGAEVFFIDASWYAPPNSSWATTVGDWEVDRERFPDGLEPFRRRVHEKGMLWGLWLDAERSGQTCQVDGFTLMNQGLTVRLEGALTSELLLFEPVEESR